MTKLAQSSAGRILLHFLAMVGSGNIRFHFAGIVRELDAVAAARAQMRERLLDLWMTFLTSPVRKSELGESKSLSTVLRPGDVLLTEGTTRAAIFIKLVTGSSWSHVAMYVGPLADGDDPPCIVEADIEQGVRTIRLSELEAVHVRVLRPIGLSEVHRLALAEWLLARIGSGYDMAHAWALCRGLLRARVPARRRPLPGAVKASATQFICSNLLASAFAMVGLSILPEAALAHSLSGADYRNVIPADFERAQAFEVVEWPHTFHQPPQGD
jgi:Permuted papain-like amidase enzyme, YaeF/YiiX, C92 family